jgi:hypothetical protein
MLSQILSGFRKFFNRKELVIGVVIVLIGVALLSYSNSKSFSLDNYDDGYNSAAYAASSYSQQTNSLSVPPTVPSSSAPAVSATAGYTMQPVNSPSDLLPADANSEWAALNPSMNAGATPDLLQAGYHIGLDTIGQTLKNANLQLRSDPIIPTADVGPWNQSTYEADIGRVPLEIGYGGR